MKDKNKEPCKLCQHSFPGLPYLVCHYKESECPILRDLANEKWKEN